MKNKPTQFEAIFRAITLPCVVLKPSGDHFLIVEANDAYLEGTQTVLQDLVGKSSEEAFPKNPSLEHYGSVKLLESYRRILNTRKKDHLEKLRYDIPNRDTGEFLEKYWRIENVPLLDDEGEVEFILHIVKDITDQVLSEKKQQRLQQELLENQKQHQHFIEENPDGLYSLDPQGNFTSANQGIADIAGLPMDQLLQTSFVPFCAPGEEEHILSNFQIALNGKAHKFEGKFVSAKGRHMILNISLLPMLINGEVVSVHGIAKDVTSYRQTENVVVQKRNFLEANANFISALMENDIKEGALQEALAVIGKAVKVDRIYYFAATQEEATQEVLLSMQLEWTSTTASAQINNPEMQNLPASYVERMMGTLTRNEPFTAVISELREGELKKIFLDQDIQSMLVMPIFLNKKLFGFIGFDDCTQERQWSDDEITFLRSLANNLSTTFEKRSALAAVKEQEEALQRSEQKFKALVQEGSDLLGIINEEGIFSFLSGTTLSILGFHAEELLDKNLLEYVHQDDVPKVVQQFSLLEKNKQVKLGPYRFRNKQGNWRWLETTATDLSSDPAVRGIVSNSRDVTELLEQAQEIAQINERYQMAASATKDIIYDWDLVTDEVTRFLSHLSEFLGHSPEKVNTREFWPNHLHPDEVEPLRTHLKEILANPEANSIHTEYRIRRANGTYAHISDRGLIMRNHEGRAVRLVGASTDISDLKRKEEELIVANKRFKRVMKATSEMIWDWNIVTGEMERSEAFNKVYGYKVTEESSHKDYWTTRIVEEDKPRVEASLQAALEDPKRKNWKANYSFLKANGEIAHVTDRAYIIRDENKKAIRVVGSTLDVTATRKAMKRIEHQNKLLKQIAWEQSHVVRAPLARIKGLVNLLEMKEFKEMPLDDILGHIKTSTDELDEVVRTIVNKTEELEY